MKIVALETNEASGDLRGSFALQQVSNVGGTNAAVLGFDSAPRWAATFGNYEAYAITGMKVKWIPTNMMGGIRSRASGEFISGTGTIDSLAETSYLGTQFLWYDMDTYNASAYDIPKIASLDKAWNYDPKRTWKRWFGAKQLSRAQNVPWQDTAAYVAGTANTLTNASVSFIQPYKGMGEGGNDVFGYFKVSWYCTFKGQAYQQ
uniref:hypothetical protein n=1 Tax=Limnohabitans sp. TaxID=1907725 RepID=UPI0040474B5D